MKCIRGKCLLTFVLVAFLCMMNLTNFYAEVYAENYSSTDAGEIIVFKSLETGVARYINYTKHARPFSVENSNAVYETDCYNPHETGGASTFSIIGSDGRVPATDTNVFPNAAVLYVYTVWPDGKASRGTAFMVNETQAMTAGHCVYSSAHGGMAKSITVTPGRAGDKKPYGSYAVKSIYLGGQAANSNADWGVLTLGTTLGNTTGYYGVRLSASNLSGTAVRITGYPSDKGYALWTQKGKISSDSNFRLKYTIDTYGGQSGSPIFQEPECITVGIHTTGSTSVNSGVKISERLFLLIGGSIYEPGGFSDGNFYTESKDGPFTDGHD